jgi:hypothetical protein
MTDRSAMCEAPATGAGSTRSGVAGVLARRWPTLLAVALVAPAFVVPETPESVRALAGAMMLLPLWYVAIAAIGRRGATWSVLIASIVLYTLLRLQDRVEPAVVLLAAGVAAVLWGTIRGRAGQPSFVLQVAGLVAWSALALAGLLLDPDVARYVIAAGWFAHGLWDVAHHRADATVSRSAAEWCGVVDVLVAVQLVVLPVVF